MNKTNLISIWRKFLVLVFIYSFYHLIRDILQDIFNIHNPFTEFLHQNPQIDKMPNYFKWINFFGYRKYITFPIEIFLLLAIPKVNRSKRFNKLDGVILFTIVFTVGLWLIYRHYSI